MSKGRNLLLRKQRERTISYPFEKDVYVIFLFELSCPVLPEDTLNTRSARKVFYFLIYRKHQIIT